MILSTEPGNDSEGDQSVIKTPRLFLSGTDKSKLTTLLVCGLLAELKRRHVAVAAAKVGPSLVDTTHYRRITGRLSHSLIPWVLTGEQIVHSFARLSSGSEIVIIDGELGLFDQRGDDCSLKCDADVAQKLRAPIVLIVDAAHSAESLAAVVSGFANYDSNVKVRGVVALNVKDENHEARIRNAVQALKDVEFLGGISSRFGELEKESLDNPSLLTRNHLVELCDLIRAGIDIEALLRIAADAQDLTVASKVIAGELRSCRIAVADDQVFHLTIQDNLDLIRRAGGELIAFSPLADPKLPRDVWGVYLPSGYTYLYGNEIASNKPMVKALRSFVKRGGLLYAEGDSLAYLCSEFSLGGDEPLRGVGLLSASASAFSLSSFIVDPLFYEIVCARDVVIGSAGMIYRGMADSRWVFHSEGEPGRCYEIHERSVLASGHKSELPTLGGMSPLPNIMASNVKGHWGSCPELAAYFVKQVKEITARMET